MILKKTHLHDPEKPTRISAIYIFKEKQYKTIGEICSECGVLIDANKLKDNNVEVPETAHKITFVNLPENNLFSIRKEEKTVTQNNQADRLQIFLNEIAPYCETPEEQLGGFLSIPLKEEIKCHCDKLVNFLNKKLNPLKKELQLDANFTLAPPSKFMGVTFNLGKYHTEILRIAFNKIRQDQIAESVKFLSQKMGWTEEQFLNEIGMSKISTYRYLNDKYMQKAPKTKESTVAPADAETQSLPEPA